MGIAYYKKIHNGKNLRRKKGEKGKDLFLVCFMSEHQRLEVYTVATIWLHFLR